MRGSFEGKRKKRFKPLFSEDLLKRFLPRMLQRETHYAIIESNDAFHALYWL
jgi:hypothetical protein